MTKILVTGGKGFIGAKVSNLLREAGVEVAVMELPNADVRDAAAVRSAMEGCNGVIHVAGMLGTDELFDTIGEAIDTNIKGTVNVLEAARQVGAGFVGITMPPVFPSVYTATKMAADHLERAFHHSYGVPVSRVCAFNAFGPGQKYGAGHPQKIVPTFARWAWSRQPIKIWGDGEQTVDLVHANDLARMMVDALDFGNDETFDGGTGVQFTVNEVAEMVNRIAGSDAGIEHIPMRRGELPQKIGATGRGWDLLGWSPEFDEDQLAETVHWYKKTL